MKRKNAIHLCFLLVVLVGAAYLLLKPTSLDFSKDEEPFKSMAMPLKQIEGDYYMDGGSISVVMVDASDKIHDLRFYIDTTSTSAPYPTAHLRFPDRRSDVRLKDVKRAKAIAIQLLKDYPDNRPDSDGKNWNEIARKCLDNPIHYRAARAFDKLKDEYRYYLP
ncbi:MAG: hypothetical protein EOP85_10035 [Verrucomicrobiaceae bacterium]|nr:MAG: hypothetical protein EOP85_10035 [Verrucomicrobiaceae bacterium]